MNTVIDVIALAINATGVALKGISLWREGGKKSVPPEPPRVKLHRPKKKRRR